MSRKALPHRFASPYFRPLLASALAAALVLSLAACSKKEGAGEPATQVAAKVGDSEISVHQINQVLSRTPMEEPTQESLQAASKQILERLIDQQLAVNAATDDNLHRTPEVIAALEAARRDVLARAYLQKLSANVAKATPEEVAQYYSENPALFSERRVFNLQEIRVPDATAVLPELRTLAGQGKTIEEIAGILHARQVPFSSSNSSRSAEQIPLDLLPRIHALKDGQGHLFEAGKAATFVRVVSSQPTVTSEQDAAPAIEKFLNNRHMNDAAKVEIKRLREASTIKYLGEFSKPAINATAPPVAPSQQPATAASAATAAADQGTLERGVQGLK